MTGSRGTAIAYTGKTGAGDGLVTRTGFSCWDNRIAPVCDVARQVRVVDAEAGQPVAQTDEWLPTELARGGVARLSELRVDTLVCGAISWPVLQMVSARGIKVVPFVAGDLADVVRAWLTGQLREPAFDMPGCGNRRRQRGLNPGKGAMAQRPDDRTGLGWGRGQGGGQGLGRQGRGRGRMGGPMAGGVPGTCVCPACGHRDAHERGVPCVQKACPACGAMMRRE